MLHDEVQQLLFSLLMRVQNLKQGEASQDPAALEEIIRQAVQTTRDLAADISPPILKEEGITAVLRWLVPHMQERYGLRLVLDITLDEELSLSEERRILLFNSARELLFNVVKHTEENHAGLESFCEDNLLTLIVRDGEGFNPSEAPSSVTGLGLPALRERFKLLGGDVEVISNPGQGTRVTLTLPLE